MSQFVRTYYNDHAVDEQKRLDAPLCRIEFVSTLKLIEKYFPTQGQVCDIGGGTGRYTIELLRKGYQVSLLDLSDEEIRLAAIELDKKGLAAEQLVVGDARDLSMFASNTFDAALLLGPMYHIIESNERAKVLQELKRILKPQGVTIIAYLNSWGLIKTGIADFPQWYNDSSFLRSMLSEHTFAAQNLVGFTECYWSTAKAALQEIETAGFEVLSYAGAESFAGGMGAMLEQVATNHPEAYQNIVQMAAETSELAQYRDSTDHLHIVARKKKA